MKHIRYFLRLIHNTGVLVVVLAALFGLMSPAVAEDLPEDDQMMLRLFALHSKLAKRGNLESMVRLGIMYERGEGVAKNTTKARELFRNAADKGSDTALELLDKLDSKKSDSRLLRDTAEITVPIPRIKAREDRAALERQHELERKLEQEKASAVAAHLELERLLKSQREEQEKQQALKREIEQIQQSQEQLAKERAKAEAVSREMAVAAKKHAEELQKQAESGKVQQEVVNKDLAAEVPGDQQTREETKKFSSNPCNTPAAKFMSTCN